MLTKKVSYTMATRYTYKKLEADVKQINDTLAENEINEKFVVGSTYGYTEIRFANGSSLESGTPKECYKAVLLYTNAMFCQKRQQKA